jgi:hypothetical protein
MFDSITNRAEFFSDHYLNARLGADLKDLREAWDTAEGKGEPTARAGLRSAPKQFFPARAAAVEAAKGGTGTAAAARRADATRELNDVVLRALGFAHDADGGRTTLELPRAGGTDTLVVPAAARVETPTGLLLVALDCGIATDVDELFDATPFRATDETGDAGLLVDPLLRDGGKHAVFAAADAPGELFSVDEAPRFVLLCAGTVVLLAERSKWAEGRFLAVDLDAALERVDTKARGELETIAALLSADALVPGHLGGDNQATSVLDQLTEASQKHAVGVSKELRDGMRRSVEILANEVIEQRLAESRRRHDVRFAGDQVDPRALTTQCLRYLYRLIVLLYAESRPELGVLPVDDDAYLSGYSVDRLRELVLVDLADDHARNGHHFQDSLDLLFRLVNRGNHTDHAQLNLLAEAETERSHEDYLEFPGLDATIFDRASTPLLNDVTLRNEALQKVLHLLMVSPGRRRDDQAGFISYAELGINQLGAVYEGLMAYTGFFAKEDLYEVAKGGDPSDGTWMVPVTDADQFPAEVFVTRTDPDTGVTDRVRHPRGSFVYRLAGRDRQRSASYYTPEVLTSCVVRHALAELLGTDDHARIPGGSAGITQATEILHLTVCEPALGSGAFLNEAINQLSAEYLQRRQDELGEVLDAERYQRELQKVKAHFALHQCYGVDLNATAVELAEVSLWLNCMHPGLKAPWFGLQLRRGNSLIGARRAAWSTEQLFGKAPGGGVWARDKSTAAKPVVPPTDRPLSEPLLGGQVHHFLLPGHGWGAVSGRKEAKELAPDAAKALAEWRKAILKAPTKRDEERLLALANGVERLWAEATDVLERLHTRLRRPLGLYGTDDDAAGAPDDSRQTAERILSNPDSALGRLRLVMDAWAGLWFWRLDDASESSEGAVPVRPPSWADWLAALDAVIGPEPTTPTGQLDLFADLGALEAVEQARASERDSVDGLLKRFPWLARAQELAQREGAWHWELEFAPVFRNGGFDLQVGNPPWVQLTWDPGEILADKRPLIALATDSSQPESPEECAALLRELPRQSAVDFLSSPSNPTFVPAGGSNLYRAFLGTTWRNAARRGATGLLHPSGMFWDSKSAALRVLAFRRTRRLFEFSNQLKLFPEIGNTRSYAVAVYGSPSEEVAFLRSSFLLAPVTLDASLSHTGEGPLPGTKTPGGAWDLRPHSARVYQMTPEELRLMWLLLGSQDQPDGSRLMSVVTSAELDALQRMVQADHLSPHDFGLSTGISEDQAVADGLIREVTDDRAPLRGAVLQSPHFGVGNAYAQETTLPYRNHRSYRALDLEDDLRVRTTRYRLTAESSSKISRKFVTIYKRWCDPVGERTLEAALVPDGVPHLETAYCATLDASQRQAQETARLAGFWSTLPLDYLVKSLGNDNIRSDVICSLPWVREDSFDSPLLLRALRLNCLTADYAPLWEDLFDASWRDDAWAADPDSAWGGVLARVPLGDVGSEWTMATPLRHDAERRMALVELDAIAAIMLGLTAEQLCAMYRTQFAVLRKYEYAMAFDAEGRKVCQHHQSAGYRQAQLQQQAKDGQIDKHWKSVWQMVLDEEEHPGSVDWEGHFTPPFVRPDREAEMTRAYQVFTSRLNSDPISNRPERP